MKQSLRRATPWLLMAALLALTALVYLPGLGGSYIYDDVSFIIANDGVHVTDLVPSHWAAASFSFPGGLHQGRWLGMLTFAANYYFGELDPFGFKLVNLVIHLVNGLLVFLLMRNLLALWRACCRHEATASDSLDDRVAAAVIAGVWLVMPINLTAVLYVAQRLESLSNTFVFLGLSWYAYARLRQWRGEAGAGGLWVSVIVCTGLGVLVKESAVLLPLYAACIEFFIARAQRADGTRSRAVLSLYCVLLLTPLVIGLAWLATWIFGPSTYVRSFDSWQRLLSEARVLVDYIQWSLLPRLDVLTLYHDDIQPSKGLLDPPTTLACVIALLALMGIALWQRQRRPLFALGIGWFFCGHALTATVIPLLLAFEHRNYFASLGLAIAVTSLVSLEGFTNRRRIGIAIGTMIIAFYAFTTWMRAEEWSDPLRLALSESGKRPRSPLAQYERARAMIAAGTLNGRPLFDDALLVLQDNRSLPGAGIAYEAALITLTVRGGLPSDPTWWDSIVEKLKKRPPSLGDAQSLEHLSACFVNHDCKDGIDKLGEAFRVAMSHPHPSAYLLSAHGEFAWRIDHDLALAEREFRAAIEHSPGDSQVRALLVEMLLETGRRAEAKNEIDVLRRANRFGVFDGLIARLDGEIEGQAVATPPG
jgi:hypothetical protein